MRAHRQTKIQIHIINRSPRCKVFSSAPFVADRRRWLSESKQKARCGLHPLLIAVIADSPRCSVANHLHVALFAARIRALLPVLIVLAEFLADDRLLATLRAGADNI